MFTRKPKVSPTVAVKQERNFKQEEGVDSMLEINGGQILKDLYEYPIMIQLLMSTC